MRPRLVVEGLPTDARAVFVTTETDSRFVDVEKHEPMPFVPSRGRVRVTAETATWRAVGEAGAAHGGARIARLEIAPTPYVRLRVRSSVELDLTLKPFNRGESHLESEEDEGGAAFVTQALGRVFVEGFSEDDQRLVAVDLPPDSARPVDIVVDLDDPKTQLPAGTAVLDIARADGRPIEAVRIDADTMGGEDEPPISIRAPTRLRLDADGLQPLHLRLDGPGTRRVVWAEGGIVVTVSGAGDRPCRALLDGALHDVVNGLLDVRGVAPGEHALVLSPANGPGVRWKFRLAEGQVIERRLTLPPP